MGSGYLNAERQPVVIFRLQAYGTRGSNHKCTSRAGSTPAESGNTPPAPLNAPLRKQLAVSVSRASYNRAATEVAARDAAARAVYLSAGTPELLMRFWQAVPSRPNGNLYTITQLEAFKYGLDVVRNRALTKD